MKHRILFLSFFIIVFGFNIATLFAQMSEIHRSDSITNINNQQYYVHTISKDETLYSLSKFYQVPLSEIYEANPDAQYGIRMGATLLIPLQAEKKTSKTTLTSNESSDDNLYIYHQVKKSETYYGIAQKYHTTVEAIRNANPELSDILQEHVSLRIPYDQQLLNDLKTQQETEQNRFYVFHTGETLQSIAKTLNTSTDELIKANPDILKGLTSGDAIRVPKPHQEKKADSSYYYHVVKQGETIYGISKKYGVSIDSILAKNKKIQNNKISINDTLIIHYYHNIYNFIEYKPENKEALIDIANRFQISLNELQQKNPHLRKTASKNEIVFIPIKQQTPAVIMVQKQRTASPEIFNELVQTKDSLCIGGKDVNKTFTVALILPFSSRSISGQSRSTHKTTEANTKFRYVAFYNGFRMALDSIAAQGFNITLNVYDVTDVLQMEQLLEKPDMKKTDLIFCITYSELFTKLADFSRQYQIPLINIASHRNEILTGYPDVAKLFPDETDISKSIQQIIADNHQFNFIVVRKNNTTFQNIVQNLKIVYPNVKEHFTEGKGAASIEKMLNSWNKNYVLILGDNKVEILDVMRFLSEKRKQYDVTLVGYPNWNEIQELEYRYAQELKLHIIAPYVVDDNLQLVKNFVYLYRARFNDEPSYFSFQGYDIAIHFITSLGYFGKKCLECSNHLQDNLLSTEKFLLQNTSGNGYNNNYWDIYTFDNYQIIRLEN